MALQANRILLALAAAAALAQPALAQNYDYQSRSDFISLSAGDAPAANIAIQTPTPWPAYVNDVAIPGYGPHAVNVIEIFNTLPKGSKSGSSTSTATTPAQ
jgi:hypothetical protein